MKHAYLPRAAANAVRELVQRFSRMEALRSLEVTAVSRLDAMSGPKANLTLLSRGDLSGARELRLGGCGLTEFPDEIFGLADTLEILDLSNNALTELPDGLGRLPKLRALFCSGNSFERLPGVLGDCRMLSQVAFRATGLREVPSEALPPELRWLTLTDNQIEELPAALGERPMLQKVILSGNRLRTLPDTLAGAANLEMIRIAANRFESLPEWLGTLPRLAWVAWAGNPLDRRAKDCDAESIDWTDLTCNRLLGEGASGHVFEASLRAGPAAEPRLVALKLFKGAMSSDGSPEREMAASLAAGQHPNVMGALGRLTGHPEQREGLVMPLLPPQWRALAGPPSIESCSRDVYDSHLQFELEVALCIARDVAAATAHLHARELLHGDLYAHNVMWDGTDGAAVLGDFGAAAFVPPDIASSLLRTEVLAWGILFGELLDRCRDTLADGSALRNLQQACSLSQPEARPSMVEALLALDKIL